MDTPDLLRKIEELKDAEIMRERLETLSTVDEYVGKYYSQEFVRKNILMQTEEEIKRRRGISVNFSKSKRGGPQKFQKSSFSKPKE